MNRAWMFLLTILLVGCGQGGGNGGSPGGAEPSPRPPKPIQEMKWGDLECQKSRRCQNPVLNISRLKIENLLDVGFSEVLSDKYSDERKVFECGKKTVRVWNEQFGPLQAADESFMQEFFFQMIDITNCRRFDDYESLLNHYFTNTGDYKNEIH